MGLLQCILGSSDKTRVTSTLVGNEVTRIEADRFSIISEVSNQETTSIPAIKTEPNVQMGSTSFPCKGRKDVCPDPSVITSEPRSINDLSDEILLNILSYFGPKDLCLIAKVCQRWNALGKDVVLWKTHSYTVSKCINYREIEEVLTNAPALRSLIIRDREVFVPDILKFLFNNRIDLRRLTFKCCCILGEYDLCATLVDMYPDLEGLSLEGYCSFGDYGLITRLKKLSELHLQGCQGLNGKTVRLIADSCQHLKKLSLGSPSWCYGCSRISDEDVIYVIDRLGKQLISLELILHGLTDVAYSYLNNCNRLQELLVYNCYEMTDSGLLDGIGSLHELTSLDLFPGRHLTAQALSAFLHRPSMSSIVLLKLWDFYNLDDEGLKGIAERCIHLEELEISNCRNVTDAGVSMVISHCSQLRVLSLTFITSITGEGWLTLVPSHLPHLRELCLDRSNVCDKYAIELRAAVPELKFSR